MKLNPKLIRYLSKEHYRVLTATEMGSRNHEVVPVSLIEHIAQLKTGGIQNILADLAKNNLVAKVQNIKYDGYRLTYGGYDFLALKTFSRRDVLYSVGHQIGVGKESDIQICADEDGHQMVLKMHRLGRTSFRNVKEKRDYLKGRKTKSWLYLSRLSAMKEFAFMKVLFDNGFPVPEPIDFNRHCIVMGLIDAYPLCQIKDCGNPERLYSDLMNMIVKLAQAGLIHGDFNEFNLLVGMDGKPWLIDFPQMVSTTHKNAQMYFERDVNCIRTFFLKKYGYQSELYPVFNKDTQRSGHLDLDIQASASGYLSKKEQEEFDVIQEEMRRDKEKDTNTDNDNETEYESDSDENEENEKRVSSEQIILSAPRIAKLQMNQKDMTISPSESGSDPVINEHKDMTISQSETESDPVINEHKDMTISQSESGSIDDKITDQLADQLVTLTIQQEMTPNESESDADIRAPNNTAFKAHRDSINPNKQTTGKRMKKSKQIEKFDAMEIKRRVSKGIDSANQASNRKRNSIKATTRRINRETAGCTGLD